jgi:hypothetical protein
MLHQFWSPQLNFKEGGTCPAKGYFFGGPGLLLPSRSIGVMDLRSPAPA